MASNSASDPVLSYFPAHASQTHRSPSSTATQPQSAATVPRKERRSPPQFSQFKARSPRQPPRWVPLYEAVLIGLFILLGTVGLLHHELWRDETQAWLLARDSPSVLALFQNAHYEGHPLLWHYCLYAISRISRSLMAMQIFNLLLAIGSVWLIVKKSPFSLLTRSLLIFGYFTFYEYALLSRSYGLGVFLTLLFCALYCAYTSLHRRRAWLLTITLGLLANTSILGLVMSGSLAIALYYRLSTAARPIRKSINTHCFSLAIAWIASAFQILRSLSDPLSTLSLSAHVETEVSIASMSGEAIQMVSQQTIAPVASKTAETTSIAAWLENADKLLQIILKSYLPLPTFQFHFWNSHLLENQSIGESFNEPSGLLLLTVSAGLTVTVLFTTVQLLRRTKLFLFIYAIGCSGMTAIFIAASIGAARHYGHLFILFLACLWLASGSRQSFPRSFSSQRSQAQIPTQTPAQSFAAKLFTAILCVHVVTGLYAYTSDLFYPFSASYQTAQILTHQLEPLPILAINQRPISPVSGYIDRKIFYPEAGELGSFWDISYPEITDEAAIATAIKTFASTHADFVAVLTLPIDSSAHASLSDLAIQDIAYIGPSIVEDESFFLYRVKARQMLR